MVPLPLLPGPGVLRHLLRGYHQAPAHQETVEDQVAHGGQRYDRLPQAHIQEQRQAFVLDDAGDAVPLVVMRHELHGSIPPGARFTSSWNSLSRADACGPWRASSRMAASAPSTLSTTAV